MGIFSKLFDSPEARAKKALNDAIKSARRELDPIFGISQGIAKATGYCSEEVSPLMNFPTKEKNGESRIYVVFEFVYFFMHLTRRSAFSVLGDEGKIKLAKELSPLIVPPIIEGLFGHWPKNPRTALSVSSMKI